MPRFKAIIAYDGTPYHGWQIQPSRPTIQGRIAEALHHLTGESTLPQGAGRTDTGVHALAQVAHFDIACSIPAENLHRALNRSLPPSIRILTLTLAPPGFHARHSARHKTYEYRILPHPISSSISSDPQAVMRETICTPFLASYIWPCPRPVSLGLLNDAAAKILGTHDFTSFAAVDPDRTTRQASSSSREHMSPFSGKAGKLALHTAPEAAPNTRTILSSAWTLDEAHDHIESPPILRYRVTGTGFLHHMVRNLVGTFVECGAARLNPAAISAILAALNRQAAGPTAPPQGLFLAEVAY